MMERILIVKTSSLGDVVLTLPAVQRIRAAFPQAHLGWVVEGRYAELLRGQPWLDEVIAWERGGLRGWFALAGRLRKPSWTMAVDFQGLYRSALVTRFARAQRRFGYRPAWEPVHWTYTSALCHPARHGQEHAVDYYNHLAAHVAGQPAPTPLDRPYLHGRAPHPWDAASDCFPLHPTPRDRDDVDRIFQQRGYDPDRERLVVIVPDCRKEANRWPPLRFRELMRRLSAQDGIRVALCGGPASRRLCDELAEPFEQHIWRCDGQLGILGSAELLRRASVVVTGDTGPMHLAAAVGTPIVALFGPADPQWTGPYTTNAVVLRKQLPCSPCLARHCPLGLEQPDCMTQIHVAEVEAAVLSFLDKQPRVVDVPVDVIRPLSA